MNEDKTHVVKFDVLLVKSGSNKVQMMGIIMDVTGWGLKQSKDLIDEPPGFVVRGVSHSRAMEVVQRLEAAGAKADIQRVLK
jgi:large subunit ribosomal protein L7/L12